MSYVLRKIARTKWLPNENNPQEIPADTLTDLKTEDNKLSVWHIEPDKSNLPLVLTALASNCDRLTHIDYVLINRQDIEVLGIQVIQSDGKTPCISANPFHRDLVELSAQQILEIAKILYAHPQSRTRHAKKDIGQLLSDGCSSGLIDKSLLKATLKDETERLAPPATG